MWEHKVKIGNLLKLNPKNLINFFGGSFILRLKKRTCRGLHECRKFPTAESVLRYLHNFLSNLYTYYQIYSALKQYCTWHSTWHHFLNALLVHLHQQGDPSKLRVVRRFEMLKMAGRLHTRQKEGKLFRVWVLTFITNQNKNTIVVVVQKSV